MLGLLDNELYVLCVLICKDH